MDCQYEGCINPATFHITILADDKTLHYCEVHAREYFESEEPPSEHKSSRVIDFSSFCFVCGNDERSYKLPIKADNPAEIQSETVSCPSCWRAIANMTGIQHSILFNTCINWTMIQAFRIIPISDSDGVVTVLSDFADIEALEKFRFIHNADFKVVFAESYQIDTIIKLLRDSD